MSDLALERYLKEIAPGSPCGENLENESDFATLEQEVKGTPERQIGDLKVPAKEPDWKKVRDLAFELLERSRDIQVVMHLTCALVHIDGFGGLDNGLTLIRELLRQHWDDVYPRKDTEDDYPVQRMNTLSTLTDYNKILGPLVDIPLTNSKLGSFSWNQIETSKNRADVLSHMAQDAYEQSLKKDSDQESPDTLEEAKKKASDQLASIQAAFKDTKLETLKNQHTTIKHALDQVEGIVAITSDKAGTENAPDISRLVTLLKSIQNLLDEKIKLNEVLALEQSASGTDETTPAAGIATAGIATIKSNGIHTREDVVSAIDVISKYFESYEPSSPVPFLLQRAKKLLSMNFIEILQDLTPDAVSQAENICGVQKQNKD